MLFPSKQLSLLPYNKIYGIFPIKFPKVGFILCSSINFLTISKYPAQTDYTTQVYIIEASYYAQGYTVLLKIGQDSITLYCSGSGQYAWLASYATDKVLTMEVALCNWNKKDPYKAYVLAVYLEDGTKVVNPTNFAS